MFVYNEGVPRSGKSYDTMKNHVLPALKRKRHVWARMNGLEDSDQDRRQKIADYLKMSLGEINHLLHHVDTDKVLTTFAAYQDKQTGVWSIPDDLKNAVIVIDEIHEFYVKKRNALPPEQSQFFALLGQNGSDGVLMTQCISELHPAVFGRVEKKNGFQKLTAVGLKGRYQQNYFQTVAPMKFKLVGSKNYSYDPEIFPLYKGYADGVEAESIEPYSAGSTNVWKGMALRASIFGVVGLVSILGLMYFFNSDGDSLVSGTKAAKDQAALPQTGVFQEDANRPAPSTPPLVSNHAPGPKLVVDKFKDLNDEQRYVADLGDRGRIRLTARAEIAARVHAVISWVTPEGVPVESLSLVQLEALGYKVVPMSYGIKLMAGKHTFIATAWPLAAPVRETEAKLYSTNEAGGAADIASAASEGGGAAGGSPGVIPRASRNAAQTFPEFPGYKPGSTGPSASML